MKCWNCGGDTGASDYYAEGGIICGYCAEDFAEKEGDTCKSCDKSNFEWCDNCNDLACVECMYVSTPQKACQRHNFLLEIKVGK